jgi:hypothetical protein
MSWRAVPGPEGPALLAARGRDAALGTVVVPLTVGVFAAVVAAVIALVSPGRRRAWWTLMIGQIQRSVEGRQGTA